MTDDEKQRVKAQYLEGQTARAIADGLGVPLATITNYLTRAGVRKMIPVYEQAAGEPMPKAPTSPDVETSIFLNDIHVPSQDKDAVRVVLNFILWLHPTHVFLVGDIFDCYQLSRFDKDPKRGLELQEDLDKLEDVLRQVRLAAGPDAEIHYMEGNHERRVQTYLTRHPELAGLRGLKPENLFRLDDYNIHWHPQEETYSHHGVIVTHGTVVRKHAGRSAQGEFEKYIASGVSGHTHRAGAYTKTTLHGTYAWYENGCLSELQPEYMVGVADWQHAISVGHFVKGDNRFAIEQIQIPKGKLMYQGLLFE